MIKGMPDALNVLLIDDDRTQLELLGVICRSLDYPSVSFATAETGRAGLARLGEAQVDLVLTDHHLPDMNGLEVLREVKRLAPQVSVVVMTAFENARDAVEILKAGADDYLIKPTREPEIRHLFVRIHESLTLHREESVIRREIDESFDTGEIVYRSRQMMEVLQTAARSAASDTTVLITGDSGTGKELIARMIHRTSARRDRPFVTVNISALPESLVESELFGHRKGSFTGASEDRRGRFEEAHTGTIFIDEVGEITPALQVKLLRIIQFGEVERIGENTPRKLDVRIIAATNRDLEDMVKQRQFRADLFYRLNVIPIHVPPLRERKADIAALVDAFIARYNARHGRAIAGISREGMDLLMRHAFPGNVRELENLVERAVVLSRSEVLLQRDFPGVEGAVAPVTGEAAFSDGVGFEASVRKYERERIEEALRQSEGNQSKAARSLGLTERHLRSYIERLNIENKWKP
jgi:DNA-binding NtrC family response regulator